MDDDDIPIKQIGLPIWELDYSTIKNEFIREKYTEFANYSKQMLYSQFKKAFNFELEKRFKFEGQIPEGSQCWMTMLAEEEYRYKDNITGKMLHIYINFRCNWLCNNIFDDKKIKVFHFDAYDLYTPDINKCQVDLVYDLQKNVDHDYGYDNLDEIIDGNISKYLF
jgi:hypothetical protein